MNHKAIASEIYQASKGCDTASEASRYRKQAISGYPQEDRYYIIAYMDQIKAKNYADSRGKYGSELYGKL